MGRDIFLSTLPPKMLPTYTTKQRHIEFCVLTHRPTTSKHSLWGIPNHQYPLLSVFLVSESFAIDFTTQNAFTHTTNIILIEFCVLTRRPMCSKHTLWGMFKQ